MPVTKKLLTLVCLLSLALALGACGSDDGGGGADSSGGGDSSGQGSYDSGGGSAKSDGKVTTVDMKDIKFVPAELSVKKGMTVRWTNSDGFAHTVTKESGPGEDFDSGNVEGGATYKRKFTDPGTIAYVCTIHPNQKGQITVK